METKDNNQWFGSTLETKGTPMVDSATGKPMFLEVFEFVIKPGQQRFPSKQEIFNSHWPHLKSLIWSKGLVPNEDVTPRVVIGKKRYRIFILCELKFRRVLHDKPTTLQEIFNKS